MEPAVTLIMNFPDNVYGLPEYTIIWSLCHDTTLIFEPLGIESWSKELGESVGLVWCSNQRFKQKNCDRVRKSMS
jgi:hypothetical protein